MTDLFVGVVSHATTRFAASQGPDGLAARLARRARDRGLTAVVQVNTQDRHNPTVLPVDEATVQRSLDELLRLEGRWDAYLGRPKGPRTWATRGRRRIRRLQQSLRSPGSGMVERLVNIELSHLDLLRAGMASGAPWILILEDDADTTDLDDCAAGLFGLITDVAVADQPAYVNVSLSFSNVDLGIDHLVSDTTGRSWQGTSSRTLLASSRPVTNTVCAILYRAEFVRPLLQEMEALPMDPVVPIDWKLNAALAAMYERGDLRAGDCWMVDPGPIVQRSMRSGDES